MKKSRIDFLDYMRVFAFMSVLVGHKFVQPLEALAANPATSLALRVMSEFVLPLCRGGLIGVVVFFLTSGYIITHVLRNESAPEFVLKRLFRIYPLYVFAVVAEMLAAGAAPTISELIPRLLLIGDFFGTPYALGGVEWTLRVEVLFYAVMAGLKAFGFFDRTGWLPPAFTAITIALYLGNNFPNFAGLNDGFVNLYLPFLFVGALIYLAEYRLAHWALCTVILAFILAGYLVLMPILHPEWSYPHYAIYGTILFLGAWALRHRLHTGLVVRWLSDLTFAVYLFHNWLWPYLERWMGRTGLTGFGQQAAVFAMLLASCYITHRLIERNGIQLGRRLLAKVRLQPTS